MTDGARERAVEELIAAARDLCTTLAIGDGLRLTEPHHPSILKNYTIQVHADRTRLGEAVSRALSAAPQGERPPEPAGEPLLEGDDFNYHGLRATVRKLPTTGSPALLTPPSEGVAGGSQPPETGSPTPSREAEALAEAARLIAAMLPDYCPAHHPACVEATCFEAREWIEAYGRRGGGR